MPSDAAAAYARLVDGAERRGGPLLGGLLVGIDHIGVCVGGLDGASAGWSALLGAPAVDREEVASQRVVAAFLRPAETSVELVCPNGSESLDKFLRQRGDALHHIAFAVTDIDEALGRLAQAGIDLIDAKARRGAGGHLVAFLHPRAMGGTLIELVERHGEETKR